MALPALVPQNPLLQEMAMQGQVPQVALQYPQVPQGPVPTQGPAGGIHSNPLHQRYLAEYTKALQGLTNPVQPRGQMPATQGALPGQDQNTLQQSFDQYRQGLASTLQQQPTTYTPGWQSGTGRTPADTGTGGVDQGLQTEIADWYKKLQANEQALDTSGYDPASDIQGEEATMSFGDWMGEYGTTVGLMGLNAAVGNIPGTITQAVKGFMKAQDKEFTDFLPEEVDAFVDDVVDGFDLFGFMGDLFGDDPAGNTPSTGTDSYGVGNSPGGPVGGFGPGYGDPMGGFAGLGIGNPSSYGGQGYGGAGTSGASDSAAAAAADDGLGDVF